MDERETRVCEGCDRDCDQFADAALRGEGVSVGYGERLIISPLDVAIPAGRVTSVIGPNGCGKSTLLKALSRTMPVRSGAVYLDGRLISEMPTIEVARRMALLPQAPTAPGGLTVRELVGYGRYPHQRGFGRLTDADRDIIDWALSITHLEEFADRPLDALSGGQRQRAWIAMALAQDTGLILLDEPTTYLDMAHQLEVLELLQALNRDQGKTIALVIHELNLAARFSDWMIALRDGSIRAAGEPDAVMTPEVLREVFGLDALVEPDPWTGRPSLVSYRLARDAASRP
ncbi:MAG: ABC transporter ATP-binding protein [Eggerthellaceae bacterium]|nr:ABC transporter ATP-binding protein [Eggerthellaceae bacterium]